MSFDNDLTVEFKKRIGEKVTQAEEHILRGGCKEGEYHGSLLYIKALKHTIVVLDEVAEDLIRGKE